MSNLPHFKNIHKNETIYIIASGKSVDFLDSNFFSDKITIGINQIYKFLLPKYLVRKEHKLFSEILDLNLNTIHFISKGDCGDVYDKENISIIEKKFANKIKDNKVIAYDHDSINVFNIEQECDKLIVSNSTITSGIHLAAYMGAKYIILVGHDCGTIDGEPNFNGYHDDSTYSIAHGNVEPKEKYKFWVSNIEQQTITLKKLLKEKYGCEIYSLNPFINFGLEGHKYKR